ncbi:SRPBCC domain-containing protein [Mumia sp. DW29H23]|uniref:SRPBCC domain-containing protein n=1 Tax=Mumia sp. DW29H23 TaxID=3421241 RepID=UPI003D68D212
MTQQERTPVGLTRDAGWQIGVSKTVDHPAHEVWAFLVSPAGTDLWLGHDVVLAAERGTRYETREGTTGEIRSFRPQDRVRLTWRPRDADHDTVVQVVVSDSGPGRSMIRFHQERLTSARERAHQRAHWRTVMTSLVAALDRGRPGA